MPPKRKADAVIDAPAKKVKGTTKPVVAKPAAKAAVTTSPEVPNGVPEVPLKKSKAASKQAVLKVSSAKAAPPSKASPKLNGVTKKSTPKPNASTTSEVSPEPKAAPKPKASPKPKAAPKPKATPKPKVVKKTGVENSIPSQKLEIFVFGEGSSGELGLGSKKYDGSKIPIDVKRPRLNPKLDAGTVGVVQIATGGMHCAALTFDSKILTWGVNDQGALGRDTKWSAPLKDADQDSDSGSDSDDDFDDGAMNPLECTPYPIDTKDISEGAVFVQVVASDSATFMLTQDGFVYGCGTFRNNEGHTRFTKDVDIQRTPVLIKGLSKIVHLANGSNHMLALDNSGNVFSWGAGEQCQLGRRIIERHRENAFVPGQFGLPRNKIVSIYSGPYHSFAIDVNGTVYSWGLNNYGETGLFGNAGDDSATITTPQIVKSLQNYKIKTIAGGGHHSLAVTEDGKVLIWGRSDGSQCGMKLDDIPDDSFVWTQPERKWGQLTDEKGNVIRGANGWPVYGETGPIPPKERRILIVPTAIPGIKGAHVAAASDTSICIDVNGKAYSWGFSANYQTGLGTEDEVKIATSMDNAAIKDRKLLGAGVGGQFGLLYAGHK